MTELSLEGALESAELTDGATLSFHHHLRNGDGVLNAVLDACAARGLRGLHIAASSLFPVHAPLVGHMQSGLVGQISAGFISGPVAEAVCHGALGSPVRLQSHGGRAREIDLGELPIDVAIVAASAADRDGALSGRHGPRAFGAMGYPLPDVRMANAVIGVTDTMVEGLDHVDVAGDTVTAICLLDQIGDAGGIASGTTRLAVDEASARIADHTADVIAASGLLTDGFSFQTGAGGISLRTARSVGQMMAERGIRGEFASGGITAAHVAMLREGLFRQLKDVQCFDLAAVQSIRSDPRHIGIGADVYAGPHRAAVVDHLSAVVLGAAEVDVSFNVNVTTRADGRLIGGSGGHADTAEGAQLTIITTRLTAAGFAKLVPAVGHVTTEGKHVDVVVTDAGIAVNPLRGALAERLRAAALPVVAMDDLVARAATEASKPPPAQPSGRTVAESFDRHGRSTGKVRLRT